MAQLNDMVDSLQNQVTIGQLRSEIDDLKREVDQLKLENNQVKYANDQLKQNANLMKQDNDRRFSSLNDEVNNLKSRILDNLLQITSTSTSGHVNKRICQNQTDDSEQITDDYSLKNVDTSKREFSSLPDDAIHLILIRLPLRHRVLLRIICHQWKSIIESMCRSVRSLKLFGPTIKNLKYDKEADRSRHNLLLIDMKRDVQAPKFHKDITQLQFIPQLFCNVDQVVLSFPKTFEITIMQLLESWADRLTSLTLDIEVVNEFIRVFEYFGEAIWHRITQMPKLESLTVCKYFFEIDYENCQLDFLGQLRDLRIDYWEDAKIIRFVGPNIQCLKLKTGFDGVLGELTKSRTIFNVTHLNLFIISTTIEQQEVLQFVCRHFVSLIDLKLGCLQQIPFDEQLTQLSQLPHLTKLHLYMTSANLDHDLPRTIQFTSLQSLVLNIWMKSMTPKQKRLTLANKTERSRIAEFLNQMPIMFPVLVKLKIVALNKSTVKIIEELVNGSVLKSTDRIKCELIGN